MTKQPCAHGWIAETYREDAVVRCYRNEGNVIVGPLFSIRCTTWERAREWVDAMQSHGYRTSIAWEVAK